VVHGNEDEGRHHGGGDQYPLSDRQPSLLGAEPACSRDHDQGREGCGWTEEADSKPDAQWNKSDRIALAGTVAGQEVKNGRVPRYRELVSLTRPRCIKAEGVLEEMSNPSASASATETDDRRSWKNDDRACCDK